MRFSIQNNTSYSNINVLYYSSQTSIPSLFSERTEQYRYGMNGQEADKEIFEGAYTAEYWEYDSRIARRWNIDPIVKPWESSYACFRNNPIKYADPKGLDGEDKGKNGGDNGRGTITNNPDGSSSSTVTWENGGSCTVYTPAPDDYKSSSVPLSNGVFELKMAENGISRANTDNLTFNKMKGYAFEAAYLQYREKFRNTRLFESGTPNYRVRPDATGNGSQYRQKKGAIFGESYFEIFDDAIMYEVKGISKDVGLTKQIKGEINAASNSRSSQGGYATDAGQAQIVIVTFADVAIKQTVVQYATMKGVHLFHVTANYNPLTGELGFSIPSLLNFIGKELPIPLDYNSDGINIDWDGVKTWFNATNESGNND